MQQHPSDLLSGAGTSRERSCRNSLPTVINPLIISCNKSNWLFHQTCHIYRMKFQFSNTSYFIYVHYPDKSM